METVTVSRVIDAPAEDVREAMSNLEPFTMAAGFDEVEVDGSSIRVAKAMGPMEIELELELVDDPGAELAYEQRSGIFETMRTSYEVIPRSDGTEVTATTEFAMDVAVVGSLLDSTVIRRQRTNELEAQFDYLETAARG